MSLPEYDDEGELNLAAAWQFVVLAITAFELYCMFIFPTPSSAFLFFSRDRRPDIKSDHPNYSIGEIAKELGKEWQSMDGDEKAPFEKMTQKDRDRYEEEKRNYVPEDADDGEEEEDEYDD